MNKDIITVTSPLMPDLEEFHELLKDIWDRRPTKAQAPDEK